MKKSKKTNRIKNFIKINKKYIFTVVILLVAIMAVSSISNNSVFAKLTHEADLLGGDGFVETAFELLKKLVANMGGFAAGVLTAPLTGLMVALAFLMFMVLYLIFQAVGISNGVLSYPFPDSIVFNRMAFFDPNFINPTQVGGNAPVTILQGGISSLYYTFFIIALTIFVIAAMIIGIKLAISSIASEKAQYKQALNNWVFGIVLLFTVHLLMAGIFAVNEGIVTVAYDVAGEIEFKLPVFSGIPVVRKCIT